MRIRLLLLAIGWAAQPIVDCAAALDPKARALVFIHDWKNPDLSSLAKPENAEVLVELRKIAISSESHSAARVILLNFGDPAVITWWLTQMDSTRIRERERALGLGRLIRNPALILALEPLLLREESAEHILIADDYATNPRSVIAAFCIVNIIRNSPEFSRELKIWTQGSQSNESLRAALRKWIAVNRHLLKSGKFADLKALK